MAIHVYAVRVQLYQSAGLAETLRLASGYMIRTLPPYGIKTEGELCVCSEDKKQYMGVLRRGPENGAKHLPIRTFNEAANKTVFFLSLKGVCYLNIHSALKLTGRAVTLACQEVKGLSGTNVEM